MSVKIVKKVIQAPDFLNEPLEYGNSFSRGLRVNLGDSDLLFISGTASIDKNGKTFKPGDFPAQTKRTFANISALLVSEGACWQDIVQTRCYLKNIRRDYAEFNRLRSRFYKQQKLQPFPASVCIEANLCRRELLVEIEVIALLKSRRKKPKRSG